MMVDGLDNDEETEPSDDEYLGVRWLGRPGSGIVSVALLYALEKPSILENGCRSMSKARGQGL